jgi:serine/threonine protein kinase
MAPEVYLAHSYNEKSDVFSYGVVLYELFTRCLIVFTELPTNSTDPDIPQR